MTKLKEFSKGKIGVHNENHNNDETLYQGENIKDNIVVGKKVLRITNARLQIVNLQEHFVIMFL